MKDKLISTFIKKIKTSNLLYIIFSMILVFSLYNIVNIYVDRESRRSSREEAQAIFSSQGSSEELDLDGIDKEEVKEPLREILKLKEKNEDVIGWISIKNTNIDYPIVQGKDNQYYHRRDWLKNSNIGGSIYLDYRNDPLNILANNSHWIIYGHHMKDGSMFENLMKYKDLDFFIENPIIEITDLYESHKFEIFSAYVTDTEFYFIETRFPSNRHFKNLVREFGDRSLHESEIKVDKNMKIITLVTCSYEYDDV